MKLLIQLVISFLFGFLLIWFLFRNADWQEINAIIKGSHIGWLMVSQIFLWSSCFTRVQRWGYIVRATQPASFRSMFSATQIGFLVNFSLPVRLGEVVRAYVLGRLEKISFSRSIALVALDRINDIFIILFLAVVSLFSFTKGKDVIIPSGIFDSSRSLIIPGDFIKTTATGLSIIFLLALSIMIILYVKEPFVSKMSAILVGKISKRSANLLKYWLLEFAAGLRVLRSAMDLLKSILFSFLTWGLYIFSMAAIIIAFDVQFLWYTPLLVTVAVALFISIPLTPGVVGQYHIPVVAGLFLTLPAISMDKAVAIAIIAHILSLIPIVILGIISLYLERLNFLEILKKSSDLR